MVVMCFAGIVLYNNIQLVDSLCSENSFNVVSWLCCIVVCTAVKCCVMLESESVVLMFCSFMQ